MGCPAGGGVQLRHTRMMQVKHGLQICRHPRDLPDGQLARARTGRLLLWAGEHPLRPKVVVKSPLCAACVSAVKCVDELREFQADTKPPPPHPSVLGLACWQTSCLEKLRRRADSVGLATVAAHLVVESGEVARDRLTH